jgi:hypothetical protein
MRLSADEMNTDSDEFQQQRIFPQNKGMNNHEK